MIKEILLSLIIGISGILVINIIGSFFEFHIPLNLWTILLFGFFRIPGLIVILLILLL